MDGLPISAGRTFETIEEVEEAVKLLESTYYHPFRRFNSQSVKEYNERRQKAGSELRINEELKFAFVLYRLDVLVHIMRTAKKWLIKFDLDKCQVIQISLKPQTETCQTLYNSTEALAGNRC